MTRRVAVAITAMRAAMATTTDCPRAQTRAIDRARALNRVRAPGRSADAHRLCHAMPQDPAGTVRARV